MSLRGSVTEMLGRRTEGNQLLTSPPFIICGWLQEKISCPLSSPRPHRKNLSLPFLHVTIPETSACRGALSNIPPFFCPFSRVSYNASSPLLAGEDPRRFSDPGPVQDEGGWNHSPVCPWIASLVFSRVLTPSCPLRLSLFASVECNPCTCRKQAPHSRVQVSKASHCKSPLVSALFPSSAEKHEV